MPAYLFRFLIITFVCAWTFGDVFSFDYQAKMQTSLAITLVIAYMNNAHGHLWRFLSNDGQ